MNDKELIINVHADDGGAWLEPLQELIRCKDCKHRVAAHPRYAPVTAICDLDTGDPFELGRNAYDDNWFCADGEKKEND